MAHLQLRQARSGRRVLPVFYTDNYLSLLPGETKSLTIEAAAASLEGAPLLAVDGWNVTVNPTPAESGKTVQIAPNAEAQALGMAAAASAATNSSSIFSVNCGGTPLGFFQFGAPSLAIFSRDVDYKGGTSASTAEAIDTSAPNAAPAAVYQTERWGRCTYTLLVPRGQSYTIRLHFAETKLEAGQRKFNVVLNGQRILSDFDIAAEAGKNKALIKDFPSVTPDAEGHITLALTRGSADEPKICGIQILK
jgi:hypothetical protein